jgi:hypothetical protein
MPRQPLSDHRVAYGKQMDIRTAHLPTPPDGLRPGQIGVIMIGRVVIADIAATLVDLALRQVLRVEEPPSGDTGPWLISQAGH